MINTIKTSVVFSRLKPTVVFADGETPATTYGDMKKSVYDPDNDGKVNSAANADNASHASTADTATSAANANHATTADSANIATTATTASTANNAQQLNSQPPAYYLSRGNHTGNTPLASIDNTGGAIGDLLAWNGTSWEKLSAGQQGQVLLSPGTGQKPKWVHGEYILGKSNVEVTLTNSLSETILYSLLIPAGSLNLDTNLEARAKVIKNLSSSGVNVYFKINNTLSLSGAVTIGLFRPGTSILYADFRRTVVFRNSLNSQLVYNNTVNTITNDYLSATSIYTTLNIDFSQDNYLMFSASIGNIADILTLYNIRVLLS